MSAPSNEPKASAEERERRLIASLGAKIAYAYAIGEYLEACGLSESAAQYARVADEAHRQREALMDAVVMRDIPALGLLQP